MNEITTQITNENIKFKKWLTSSARPVLIFSTSLQLDGGGKKCWLRSITYIDIILWKAFYGWRKTYSVIRIEKLVLPAAMSYQPMSCRINDSKYFIRMRVTWRIAVRLKQSTQKIPNTNCQAVDINDRIKYAIESSIIASTISPGLAFSSLDFETKKKGTQNLRI